MRLFLDRWYRRSTRGLRDVPYTKRRTVSVGPPFSATTSQPQKSRARCAASAIEWAEGRRYLGLDILSRSRLTKINTDETKINTGTTKEAPTPAALTA
jgi:hypothetical protein